jgi:hypothetical protein
VAAVPVYAVNDGVLRPSPSYDFDSFCTPAPFVQDGARPFSDFVLAGRPLLRLPALHPKSALATIDARDERGRRA